MLGLLTLALYIVIQQLENNLVVPKVMERAVSLHPLAVMLALLAGGELLGIRARCSRSPVTAALSVIFDEVRQGADRRPTGRDPSFQIEATHPGCPRDHAETKQPPGVTLA